MLVSCLAFSPSLAGQQASAISLPTIFTKSLNAMSGGVQLADVSMSAAVNSTTASGTESGAVTLKAIVTGTARIEMDLPSGSTSEVSGVATSRLYGNRQDRTGTILPISPHNLMIDPTWFVPEVSLLNLSALVAQGGVIVVIPPVTDDPTGTIHLRFFPSGGSEDRSRRRGDFPVESAGYLLSMPRRSCPPKSDSRPTQRQTLK